MANPKGTPENLRPPWKPGESPNPGGKTSAHRKAEVEAAELSAKLRLDILRNLAARADGATTEEKAALLDEMLNGNALRLFKDSEDRAHGTPTQQVEHKGGVNLIMHKDADDL